MFASLGGWPCLKLVCRCKTPSLESSRVRMPACAHSLWGQVMGFHRAPCGGCCGPASPGSCKQAKRGQLSFA